MSNNTEEKIEDIGIDSFVDIVNQNEKEDSSQGKTILDDLEPQVSIDDLSEAKESSEAKEEKDEDSPSIESFTEGHVEAPKSNYENNLSSAMRSLMDDGIIASFNDGKDVNDYSVEDWKELMKANLEDAATTYTENAFKEDFENMSQETKAIIDYERNGGKDIKGMMMALINAKQTYDLNIDTVEGQKEIVRSYYQRKNLFRNSSSLEKELQRLEDAGDLQEKAEEFKPMLDEMNIEEVNKQLAEQERQKKAINQALKVYNDSIFNTLKEDDLNGIHITAKTKNMIFSGLTRNNYQTQSGKRTNLLYHLLEEKQYLKPDHKLIAEVTWLLADPEGYKKAVSETISKRVMEETANKLKNEQQGRNSNQFVPEEHRTIKRPVRSLFGR